MKKVLSVLVCILLTMPAFATGDATPTSKGYVDAQMDTLQDNLPGAAANTVVTTTTTAGETGTKAIYDASGNYADQQNALVTAEDANTAIQMAINGELVCREYDPTGQYCYVYDVRPTVQNNILPTDYTALEYLVGADSKNDSFGTKIITTIPWASVHRFRGTAQQTAISSLNQSVLGSSTQRPSNVNSFWGTRGSGGDLNYWYWNTYILPTTMVNFDISRADDATWRGTVNGVVTGFSTADFTDNVIIMNDNQTGMNRTFNGTVWNIQLFGNNNNLIFNGIPARRNSDDEVGMYDTVSNTFFTNSGTGTFVAGPDLNVYLPSGN